MAPSNSQAPRRGGLLRRRAAVALFAVAALGAGSASGARAANVNPSEGGALSVQQILVPAGQPDPGSGTGSPYPSTANASGLYRHISRATVTLRLTHSFPDDVDLLLVSPSGQRLVLMSQAGGGTPVNDVVLTFDDGAPGALPNETPLSSGSYKPTNYGSATDPFDPPAPGPPFASTLAAFNGGDPNGQWRLFALDNTDGDFGRINGWKLSVIAAPTIGRCANRFPLTNGPDTFTGGVGGDSVAALAGNDTVRGNANRDCLSGNSGNDRVNGGSDRDRVRGNSGNDRLNGDSSNDSVAGESGNDRASGGSGNDRVSGGSGRDRIAGNSGGDSVSGGPSNDRISGGSGRDRIAGNSGNDRIRARDGRRDRINCGSGRDSVSADSFDSVRRNCERVRR